jgi:hypothetical protein
VRLEKACPRRLVRLAGASGSSGAAGHARRVARSAPGAAPVASRCRAPVRDGGGSRHRRSSRVGPTHEPVTEKLCVLRHHVDRPAAQAPTMTPRLVRVVLADDHPMYRVNQVPQGNRASTPTAVPSVRRSGAKASEDTKPVCPVRCSPSEAGRFLSARSQVGSRCRPSDEGSRLELARSPATRSGLEASSNGWTIGPQGDRGRQCG